MDLCMDARIAKLVNNFCHDMILDNTYIIDNIYIIPVYYCYGMKQYL